MQITKEIVFHAGHMLKEKFLDKKLKILNPCHNPHGHEYVLKCTIEGKVQGEGADSGMVMNFGELKELMLMYISNRLDHKFMIDMHDPRYDDFIAAVGEEALFVMTCSPTAENIAIWIGKTLKVLIPYGAILVKVELQETYTCSAVALAGVDF